MEIGPATGAVGPAADYPAPVRWVRPSRLLRDLEATRATWELLAHYALRRAEQFAPRGDGHSVLVLPGFLATDPSTGPLRRFLRRLGYDAHPWKLGRNVGPTDAIMDGLPQRLADLHARTGRSVSVVGASLGGVFARDLARAQPDLVRQVITLASAFRLPVHATGRYLTNAEWIYRLLGRWHSGRIALRPDEDDLPPLTVPATAIYTRTDGIVPWRACLEPPRPTSENVEVCGSHSGLGHNPLALAVVADRLAQPEGQWRPYRRPAWPGG